MKFQLNEHNIGRNQYPSKNKRQYSLVFIMYFLSYWSTNTKLLNEKSVMTTFKNKIAMQVFQICSTYPMKWFVYL